MEKDLEIEEKREGSSSTVYHPSQLIGAKSESNFAVNEEDRQLSQKIPVQQASVALTEQSKSKTTKSLHIHL